MKLLTIGNPKIQKGEASGYFSAILHLAPADLSGYNTCPMASEGCKKACLNTAGRGGIFRKGETTNPIQKARIRRTIDFMEGRRDFLDVLVSDIASHIRRCERSKFGVAAGKPVALKPAFRLNGTSDIRWENVGVRRDGKVFRNVMEAFPEATFYDYTKLPNRRGLPGNYSLTFSVAESNGWDAIDAYANGMNLAVVFRGGLPTTFSVGEYRVPVVDGDESDLRFLDPEGCVVGLRAKGRAKNDLSGFVYNASHNFLRLPLRREA